MPLAYGFVEYGGPETQQFLDLEVPVPGPGQLLVAVHAAGVNPADWKVRAGTRKDTVPVTLPAGIAQLKPCSTSRLPRRTTRSRTWTAGVIVGVVTKLNAR